MDSLGVCILVFNDVVREMPHSSSATLALLLVTKSYIRILPPFSFRRQPCQATPAVFCQSLPPTVLTQLVTVSKVFHKLIKSPLTVIFRAQPLRFGAFEATYLPVGYGVRRPRQDREAQR